MNRGFRRAVRNIAFLVANMDAIIEEEIRRDDERQRRVAAEMNEARERLAADPLAALTLEEQSALSATPKGQRLLDRLAGGDDTAIDEIDEFFALRKELGL